MKAVSDATWEQLNKNIRLYAQQKGIEENEASRTDCTVTETNIHYPTDASLMNDSVRVLCRNMRRAMDIGAVELVGATYEDRSRKTKTKLYKINNCRKEQQRHEHYFELIRVTEEAIGYAQKMLPLLEQIKTTGDYWQYQQLSCVIQELKTYIPPAKKVAEQARRRIVNKEEVPASQKIFSIFEMHTDIIVKGFRDVVFGHKIVLSTGRSGLLTDLQVLKGNPKDAVLTIPSLKRQKEQYGKAPIMAATDGCFASVDNAEQARVLGVQELTFSKNGSIPEEKLVSSDKLHRALRNFRAGIEGCISFMKRVFGFTRVLDKGVESFKAALELGAASYNLTLLARISLATKATASG